MELRKPHKNILWVWRIDTALLCLVFATAIAWLYPPSHLLHRILHLVWILFYGVMFFLYLPLQYHKSSYRISEDTFYLQGGVIYTMTYSMPLENLQFVTLIASPMQRLFGLCSLRLTGAGGRILLRGITQKEGKLLCLLAKGAED